MGIGGDFHVPPLGFLMLGFSQSGQRKVQTMESWSVFKDCGCTLKAVCGQGKVKFKRNLIYDQ